LVSWLVSQLVS